MHAATVPALTLFGGQPQATTVLLYGLCHLDCQP